MPYGVTIQYVGGLRRSGNKSGAARNCDLAASIFLAWCMRMAAITIGNVSGLANARNLNMDWRVRKLGYAGLRGAVRHRWCNPKHRHGENYAKGK